jgi:hypothetical protein
LRRHLRGGGSEDTLAVNVAYAHTAFMVEIVALVLCLAAPLPSIRRATRN